MTTLVRGTEAVPTKLQVLLILVQKLLGLKPDDGGRYQDELKAKEQIIKKTKELSQLLVKQLKENIGSTLETGALLLPSSGASKRCDIWFYWWIWKYT